MSPRLNDDLLVFDWLDFGITSEITAPLPEPPCLRWLWLRLRLRLSTACVVFDLLLLMLLLIQE